MAALSVVTNALTGVDIAAASAAGGGDTFVNDGTTRFLIINGSGGAIVTTFVTSGTEPQTGLAIADLTVSTGATTTKVAGPFPTAQFGTNVSVTYDGVTSLTVSAIKG